MATSDISKIELPDGSTHNVKDADARTNVSTLQTGMDNLANDIEAVFEGTIKYFSATTDDGETCTLDDPTAFVKWINLYDSDTLPEAVLRLHGDGILATALLPLVSIRLSGTNARFAGSGCFKSNVLTPIAVDVDTSNNPYTCTLTKTTSSTAVNTSDVHVWTEAEAKSLVDTALA